MKNIHILQTKEPTRIFETNTGLQFSIIDKVRVGEFKGYHIYITSDEEIISSKDWFIDIKDKRNHLHQVGYSLDSYEWTEQYNPRYYKKIILTTNTELIEDDVQSIDNDFLEWFIKNPTCEFVEYVGDNCYREIIIPQEGYICPHTKIQCDDECCASAEDCHITSSLASGIVDCEEQKQHLINMMHDDEELGLYEEPKQSTKCYCGHTTYCDCGPLEEPKQLTLGGMTTVMIIVTCEPNEVDKVIFKLQNEGWQKDTNIHELTMLGKVKFEMWREMVWKKN